MATNDLSNKELILQNYMKELLKENFPDLDLSDTGAFMETFGLPQIKLFTPLVDYVDRIALKQSIENAEEMTETEMDELANSKGVYRQQGDYSYGYVTMIFSDIPKSGTLIIPAGTEVLSKQGYIYECVKTAVFSEVTLVDYYDPDSFRYQVPVMFKSRVIGSVYDITEGEITTIGTDLQYLERVTNLTPFTGGKDIETNAELAQRIKEKEAAPNLGNDRGYIQYLYDNFSDVEDSRIVGYGHPLMKRDIIGTYNTDLFTQTVKDVHWGTKVDIYIRGENLVEQLEYLAIQRHPVTNQYGVPLGKKPVRDIIDVKMYMNIGDLDNPDIDQSTLYVTSYSLLKDEDTETIGTLGEKAWVVFNDSRLTDASNVVVRYRYNSLLQTINDDMYQDDRRPPTADVLLKEANKKYIYGAFVLQMQSPLGVREQDRSLIRQKVYDFIDEIRMGEEIQFSDIVTSLTTDQNSTSAYELESVIDYINLPYQFIVLENYNRYIFDCLSEEQRSAIAQVQTKNAFFDSIVNKYKGYITTYDFFDILHALSHDGGYADAISQIDTTVDNWQQKLDMFKTARSILETNVIPKKLSPSRSTSSEVEYFELGELYVYEDKEYTADEWKQNAELLINLSCLGNSVSVDNYKDELHLALYCAFLICVATTKGTLSDQVDALYSQLQKLGVGTPIADELQ
jgi:hypothetical protein